MRLWSEEARDRVSRAHASQSFTMRPASTVGTSVNLLPSPTPNSCSFPELSRLGVGRKRVRRETTQRHGSGGRGGGRCVREEGDSTGGALPTPPAPHTRVPVGRPGLGVVLPTPSQVTDSRLSTLPLCKKPETLPSPEPPVGSRPPSPAPPSRSRFCLQLPNSCPGSSLWAPRDSGPFRQRPSGGSADLDYPSSLPGAGCCSNKGDPPLRPSPTMPLRWGWTLRVPRGPRRDEWGSGGGLPGPEAI